MTVPCDNCPFRKEGGIPLTTSRIREIGGMMLNPSGGTFPCHKSVDYGEGDEPARKGGEVHCAGALIFAEKHGNATQMMRIAERFGDYDHIKLGDSSLVWDNLKEWLKGGVIKRVKRTTKKRESTAQ
jgi:hypothetical protein